MVPFPLFSISSIITTKLILGLVVAEYTSAVYPDKQQPVNPDDIFSSEDEGRNIVITNQAMGARCAVAADFDGDGLMDLVSASSNDNAVSWFRNLGGQPPKFSMKKQITWSSLGSRILAVADIDEDGDIDVVGASYYDSALRWFENDGNGDFTSHVISFGVNEGQGVTVSDLNNDGSPDVIIASSGDNTIAVFRNMGGGDFCEIKEVVDDNAIGARTVVASDLNGDGWIDLASASKDDNTVAWYPNDGTGHFPTKHIISSGNESMGAYSLVSADIDNDGDNDLVVASNGNDHVSIWRNEGSGNFTKTLVYDKADFVLSVTATDFDGDGDIDIASASFFDGHINWYENVDGEGRIWKNHTIYVGIQGHYVSHADMDGDGDDDLIGVTHAENKVAVFLAKTSCDGVKQQECCYTGTEWNGTDCEPCPRGTYGNNSGVYAQCVECPSDACIIPGLSVIPPTCSGITGCTDKQINVVMCSCPPDTVKEPSSDTCQTCPDGQIRPDIGVVRGSDTIGNYTAWELEQGTCYVGKHSSEINSLDCSPGGELKIITTELLSEQAIKFDIVNTNGDLVHHYEKEITTCVSPTDCFVLYFDPSTMFPVKISIFIDDIEILNEFGHEANSSFDFGYSSLDNFIKVGSCDSVEFCDSIIDKQDPKRQIFNSFTKLFGIDTLDKKESNHYNAFCMFLSFVGKIYSNVTSTEETFVKAYPLYVLTLFYKSTNGENWYKNESWLKSFDFCSWYGVYCDSYGLVSIMNLTSNNLEGSLPTEMGKLLGIEQLILDDNSLTGPIPVEMMKLFSLKQLRLSNNKIIGIIPSEINLLENLVELDLSSNLLSDSLPVEIGEVTALEILNLNSNDFSGQFPNIQHLSEMKKLSLRSNLFEGHVDHLSNLSNLETLDLSNNYFVGDLPITGNHEKMSVLDLSGNGFSGHIPSDIEKMQSLKEIMLYNNKLTGTIPNQITFLNNVIRISLSYNDFKGTIPSEIGKLEHLTLLHLHSNRLTGTLDINRSVYSITDCGETAAIPNMVECDHCSYCCNELEFCLFRNMTWPENDSVLQQAQNMEAASIIMSAYTAFFLFIGLVCFLLRLVFFEKSILPNLPFVARNTFQEESIYKFLLSSSPTAWSFASLSMILQILIYVVFLIAADASRPDNDWEYYYNCPRDNLLCQTSSKMDDWSLMACGLLIFIFLLSDFIDGFLIIYESITISDNFGITAGVSLLFVTTMTLMTSILYNRAICTSNTELFMNSAALLFLNDLDERIYSALKKIFPTWLDQLDNDNMEKVSILDHRLKAAIDRKSSIHQSERSIVSVQSMRSIMVHDWSSRHIINIDKENDEQENPILLMERTKEKMDELQKEFDNVKRDFLKFSSLHSSECNRNVGEEIDYDGEGGNMPKISVNLLYNGNREVVQSNSARNSSLNPTGSNSDVGVKIDGNDDEEEKMPETSGTLRHEGSREVMQSHSPRSLSIEMFNLNHEYCNDENLTEYYHAQGARLPPDWNPNINSGGDLEALRNSDT